MATTIRLRHAKPSASAYLAVLAGVATCGPSAFFRGLKFLAGDSLLAVGCDIISNDQDANLKCRNGIFRNDMIRSRADSTAMYRRHFRVRTQTPCLTKCPDPKAMQLCARVEVQEHE